MDYCANVKLPYQSEIGDTVKLVLLSEHFTYVTNAQIVEPFGRASKCHENELMIK